MNWTKADIEKLAKEGRIKGYTVQKKKSKYGNKKVFADNILFDSKKEASRYFDLKLLLLSGKITDLKRQVQFELKVGGQKVCSYICDFQYFENGKLIVEDVKSTHTRKLPVYRLKKKLMQACHQIEIREV